MIQYCQVDILLSLVQYRYGHQSEIFHNCLLKMDYYPLKFESADVSDKCSRFTVQYQVLLTLFIQIYRRFLVCCITPSKVNHLDSSWNFTRSASLMLQTFTNRYNIFRYSTTSIVCNYFFEDFSKRDTVTHSCPP